MCLIEHVLKLRAAILRAVFSRRLGKAGWAPEVRSFLFACFGTGSGCLGGI